MDKNTLQKQLESLLDLYSKEEISYYRNLFDMGIEYTREENLYEYKQDNKGT